MVVLLRLKWIVIPLVEMPHGPMTALIMLALVRWSPIALSICFCNRRGVLSPPAGVAGIDVSSLTADGSVLTAGTVAGSEGNKNSWQQS